MLPENVGSRACFFNGASCPEVSDEGFAIAEATP